MVHWNEEGKLRNFEDSVIFLNSSCISFSSLLTHSKSRYLALSWAWQHNGTKLKEDPDHRAYIHLRGNSKNRHVEKDNIKKWSGIFFLNSTVIELSVIKQVQGGATHCIKWNDQQNSPWKIFARP